MNRTTLKTLVCLAALVSTAATAAEADVEDAALVEKVAVRNRLYSVAGRWELGANVGVSMLPRLTEHYNLNADVAFNLFDWLAFDVRVGYAISRHTSLAVDVASKFYANTSISKVRDLADLWQMGGNAIIGARFQPIYGKLNLTAELPVHFQLYLWVGGGAGLFTRESLVLCFDRSSNARCGTEEDPKYFRQNAVKPIVSIALGFRFFLADHHALKVEARDWSFLDSYYEGVDRTKLNGSDEAAVQAAGGQLSPTAGVTNMVQFDLGYSYIF